MIDNKTTRLLLPKPNVENLLEEDVARLEAAFDIIDSKVATINDTGKLSEEQIPDDVAILDSNGVLPESTIPAAFVSVDAGGKIPAAVVPDAIARAGVNTDITQLKSLSGGPLTLGGDAVGDYDAVTFRQARNMGGGTGPTQTGVMNYGVGSRRLHDSRAWIDPSEVVGDGQLLNRADYPDLWAYAQLVGTVTDTVWKNTPAQRGHYSTGNGTTTFRVPDLNGVKKNGDESGAIIGDSITGLFGRGDAGRSSDNGKIQQNAAPNITGNFGVRSLNGNLDNFTDRTGAFFESGNVSAGYGQALGPTANIPGTGFDASRSNAVYGRDSTTEVRPNAFIGVWVIRAKGAFTAANTSYHVINADSAAPANGTLVRGGELFSDYKVAGANYVQAIFRAKVTIGGTAGAEVVVRDSRSGSIVDTVLGIRSGAAADVGYSVLALNNPPLGSRTVLANPFGNSTPVYCIAEIFHASLQKWVAAPVTFNGLDNSCYGIRASYSEGEGIVVRIALQGYVAGTTASLSSQDFGLNYATPSPVRIHVWKMVPQT